MNLRKLILVFVLLAIISLSFALYFLISHFSPPSAVVSEEPSDTIQPSYAAPTPSQNDYCQQSQLTATVSSQGAAGNIYDTLTITNTGKPCDIILGNTITVNVNANNIVLHNQQTVASEKFILTTGAKVYSQLHYPNGPQCQNGINPTPITILYKINQTSVTFTPAVQTRKLLIQACNSQQEKTTVAIWPLSKNPITP